MTGYVTPSLQTFNLPYGYATSACNIAYQTVTTGNCNYVWPQTAYIYQDIYWQGQGIYQMPIQSVTTYASISYSTAPETQEQKQERLAREAAYQAKVDAASKRAEELLLLHLSDQQKKQYAETGYFETEINDKTYRINKGRAMNVELIEAGKAKFKYCALPSEYSPAEDVMLAQLLMLQTDEGRFLKTANRTVL